VLVGSERDVMLAVNTGKEGGGPEAGPQAQVLQVQGLDAAES
jgi:hypothetical protein